jgi:Putative peptidoglycan binding domain
LNIALARVRSDTIQSPGPLPSSSGQPLRRRLAKRIKTLPARIYLSAVLSIVLVGIGVNAVVLQHQRHPAPLFGPPPASTVAPAPAVGPAPQSISADPSTPDTSPALPPARPADTVNGSPSHAPDPITELLRGEAHDEAARLIVTAQAALVRLGYTVKADGNEGVTTQQALRDFERAHGLPLSAEITPRLVKQLMLAARAAGR